MENKIKDKVCNDAFIKVDECGRVRLSPEDVEAIANAVIQKLNAGK